MFETLKYPFGTTAFIFFEINYTVEIGKIVSDSWSIIIVLWKELSIIIWLFNIFNNAIVDGLVGLLV
jgi:hypothetical protein